MTRSTLTALLVAGLGLTVAASASAQTSQTPATPQVKREAARPIDSVEGVDLYNAYCAVCHGKDGKGRGPAAAALKAPVPDITVLGRNHGGKFSAADVEDAITGKGKMTPAHGSADMPIWGPVFRAITPDESGRTLRITNLVRYIESMQQK